MVLNRTMDIAFIMWCLDIWEYLIGIPFLNKPIITEFSKWVEDVTRVPDRPKTGTTVLNHTLQITLNKLCQNIWEYLTGMAFL